MVLRSIRHRPMLSSAQFSSDALGQTKGNTKQPLKCQVLLVKDRCSADPRTNLLSHSPIPVYSIAPSATVSAGTADSHSSLYLYSSGFVKRLTQVHLNSLQAPADSV